MSLATQLSQTILTDDSLTFAEKIISAKADGGRKVHHAGEIAVLPGDMAMAQDSTGPLAIKVFREMGVQKVWDPKKIHLVIDHSFPAPDEKVANLQIVFREFVKQQGVRLVEGSISDQHVLENYVMPGMVLFGADSHTCQAGAIGAFDTRLGKSEMAAVCECRKL